MRRTLLAAALIVGCGLAAYSNSFTDLFVGLDGKESMRDNPYSRRIWPISEALSLPLWEPLLELAQSPTIADRPTFAFALALTNQFLGTEPPAHHAVNLAIHIAAALVLFGIVRRTLRRRRRRQLDTTDATWMALAVALVWLVHPLQTESVTYIIQRAESLMGLLLLLTMYCALRALDSRHHLAWQTAATLACALATGTKETAAVAPLLVLLYDYTFVAAARTPWSRRAFYLILTAAAWAGPLTFAVKVAAYVQDASPYRFILAQPRVILHYLRLSLWPDDLFLYVNTRLFDVQSAAQVVVPAALLIVLFAATVRFLVLRHWLGFVGAWFFLTLGPTSTVFPITDLIQEHRMYVPLAALAMLAVAGGTRLLRALTPYLSAHARGVVGAALLAVVVLALGVRTYVRNEDYHHEFAMIHPADLHEDYTILADHYLSKEGLIQAEAERARAMLEAEDADARDIAFAHFIIGLAHADSGEPNEAAAALRRLLELEPAFAYGRYHLGRALVDLHDVAGAIEQLREAIRTKPDLVYARAALAVALQIAGDTARAEEELRLALEIQPRFGEAKAELGMLALRRGNEGEAARYFREALRDRPDLVEPNYELGMLYMAAGEHERAREHLARTVRLRPRFAQAHKALGMVLARLDRRDEAVRHLERAVEVVPDYAEAHAELGIVLRQDGRLDAAAAELRRAIALQPESADFHYQLGRVFLERPDRHGAVEELERAVELDPDHFEANQDLADALAARGELSEALRHLEHAAELRPDDAGLDRRLAALRGRLAGAAVPVGEDTRR